MRAGELRLGLAQIFRTRAGDEQAKLRIGLLAIGSRARQRQLGVGDVEPGDRIAGLDTVAFGDAQVEEPSSDLRRNLDVGRFDLPRYANVIRRRLRPARASADSDRDDRAQ